MLNATTCATRLGGVTEQLESTTPLRYMACTSLIAQNRHAVNRASATGNRFWCQWVHTLVKFGLNYLNSDMRAV